MADITAISGNDGDVQTAINSAQRGDTVIIPQGSYTWTQQVEVNRGWNITLIGGDVNGTLSKRPVITRNFSGNYTLYITCSDTLPKTTMRLSNVELLGPGNRLKIDGIATINQSGSTYTGGLRVDHCRFSQPYYATTGYTFTGTVAANGTTITSTDGKTFGVADQGRWIYRVSGTGIGYYPKIQNASGNTITLDIASTPGTGTIGVTGTAPQESGDSWAISGWVFGVLDHNEHDSNLLRTNMTTDTEITHTTSPDPLNPGQFGDYGAFFLPAGRGDLAGSIDALVFEDNIIHRGTGAFTDSNQSGILIARHNTTLASFASHGTRESGTRGHGSTLLEYYNNMFCGLQTRLETKMNNPTGAVENRDGEQIDFNNTIQMQKGGNAGLGAFRTVFGPDTYGCTSMINYNGLYWGADGLNPLDDNAKAAADGHWDDPENGNRHWIVTSYTVTTPANRASFMIVDADIVSAGRDTTPLPGGAIYSDVFGIVTGGTYNGQQLTGATVTGTQLPNPVPANYFRGFVLRNSAITRAFNSSAMCYGMINTSSQASSNGTTATITFQFSSFNPFSPTVAKVLNYDGGSGRMELRRVRNYWGISSRGALTVQITPNSVPLTYVDNGAAHWVPMAPTSGGSWGWGNVRRLGSVLTDYFNDDKATKADHDTGVLGYAIKMYAVWGQTSTPSADPRPLVTATTPILKPLFDRGYKWDQSIVGGPSIPATRIGADWVKTFIDPVTNLPVFSNDPLQTTGGPNGNGWPEFVSYYRNGAGGGTLPGVTPGPRALAYPHPLIVAPVVVNEAPTITSFAGVAFATGIAEDFTVTATGTPTPVFSITGATPLPTGVTLVLSSPADGTAIIRASTSTVAGTTTVNLRATGFSPAANQSFTITIATPSVTLTKPVDGTTVTHDAGVNAVVNLAATASSANGINKVEFYQVPTLPAVPVLLGTDTVADGAGEYTSVWSGMADGTYVLKAKAYDALGPPFASLDSATVSITVSTTAATPLEAPTIVVTSGPTTPPVLGTPVINSALTKSGTNGVALSYQIAATNSPTSYGATGLPSGLSVSTSTGVISGTPTAAGTTDVTISATNASGTGTATLVITVGAFAGIASLFPGDVNIRSDSRVLMADSFDTYTTGITGATVDTALVNNGWGRVDGNVYIFVDATQRFGSTGKSLRFTLPVSGTENSGAVLCFPPAGTKTLFFRLYQKWASDYVNTSSNHNGPDMKGGTITSGNPVNPDGTEGFTVLLDVNSANKARKDHAYMYWAGMNQAGFGDHLYPDGTRDGGNAPWLTNPGLYPDFVPLPMHTPNLNQWYCYELMVKLNDSGQSNGEVKWWVDGVLTAAFPNLFICASNLSIDTTYFNLHTTNQTGVPLTKYYDNVVIATEYIGPVS